MNDFDYENMQKKRLGKSALHRKCGSKSKKCTLPSDRLTAKQRKELNGMEVTYQMNKPVAWNIFKMWPNDIQREYLKGLSERYHVNAAKLADMFEIARSTIDPYLKNHKLRDCVLCSGRMSEPDIARWNDFVTLGTERRVHDEAREGENTMPSTVVQNGDGILTLEVSEQMAPVEKPVACRERVRMNPAPTDFEMTFAVGTDGLADTEAVLNFVSDLLGDGTSGMLTVRFQRARKKRSDKKVQGFCAPDGENSD